MSLHQKAGSSRSVDARRLGPVPRPRNVRCQATRATFLAARQRSTARRGTRAWTRRNRVVQHQAVIPYEGDGKRAAGCPHVGGYSATRPGGIADAAKAGWQRCRGELVPRLAPHGGMASMQVRASNGSSWSGLLKSVRASVTPKEPSSRSTSWYAAPADQSAERATSGRRRRRPAARAWTSWSSASPDAGTEAISFRIAHPFRAVH